jgi:GT2 family glycosyltransferase
MEVCRITEGIESALPKVTIGVLNRNGIGRLRKSIPSLVSLDYPNLDIIVVDGCSTDGSVDYLRQYSKVRIVSLEEPFSLPRGKEQMVCEADSPYFFSVDNDIEIPDPLLLRRLVARFEQCKKLSFLSPLVLDADTDMMNEVGLSHSRPQRKQPLDCVMNHGLVQASGYYGNCAFFRTTIIKELGGFDNLYPYHNNDYDFSARSYLHGYKVMIDTDHYVIHHGKGARTNLTAVSWRYRYYLCSMCRIVLKCYRPWNVILWLPVTATWIFFKAVELSWINRSFRPIGSYLVSAWFFLRDLPDTLSTRKRVQRGRTMREDVFLKIRPAVF